MEALRLCNTKSPSCLRDSSKNFLKTLRRRKSVTHYCDDRRVLLYVTRWLKAGIVQQGGMYVDSETGTPQGGVISPLLANIFLHVVFDKWMEKNHSEKPFERYADDSAPRMLLSS
jgi:retron-type reverse transcriptase